LWPELTLCRPDAEAAATLARRLLTDQGEADECCAKAKQRLTAADLVASEGNG
jgi:hypothetical protein